MRGGGQVESAILLPACGQSLILDTADQDAAELSPDFIWIPFGFFNETFGTAVGAGAVLSHVPAPESSLLGAVTVGSTGSFIVSLGGSQLHPFNPSTGGYLGLSYQRDVLDTPPSTE